MRKNAYFAHYKSPNIVIRQTVSFLPPVPPGPKQIADPIASNCKNYEQIISAKDSNCEPTPSGSNYQQNLQIMNTITNSNTSTPTTEFTLKNSPSIRQDTISTDTPLNNVSQSIKTPQSSQYQSRNNLVDLTGFNLLKREMSSLTKRKDLKQVDQKSKSEPDDMKTRYEKKHAHYSDSDTSKSDNIFNKKSSTRVKPGNEKDHANGEPKEILVDMEDKMKKYFNQLWNRNINKLKDNHTSSIKSCSKTKEETTDSKPESSRSKANLQNVSKSNTATDLRNKIITNSEKYRDLQKRFIAKYSTRSKSEINTRHISKSKESIRDRNVNLSPVSSKRYKDFQRFVHESKYKSGHQNKTESSAHNRMVRMKSHEPTIKKRDIKRNEDDHKQSAKNEKCGKVSTNQTKRPKNHTNIEKAKDQINKKVNLVKNVVHVLKNKPGNLTQSKCANEVQDLRSRLSRKRTRSECFAHSHESLENKLDRENLVITVKQDVKADSKNSVSLSPNVNKSKKCKKIKLIIHIEYPNSDPDDSDQDLNECCQSPEDLSFLDDFNVDEIVDSLNNSQVEDKKIITTDNAKSQVINKKINENDHNAKHKCNEETKPKDELFNDFATKAIQIKKEEKREKGHFIEINSNTEDVALNLQMGPVATKKRKIEKYIKQEVNNTIDLTGESYKKSALNKTMDHCNNDNDSVVKVIDITDKNKHNTTSEHSVLARNVNLANSNEGVNIKQEVNNTIDLTGESYKESALKKTMDFCNDGNNSVVKVTYITDENEHNTTSKHSLLARNLNHANSNEGVSNVDQIFKLLRQNTIKKSHNTVNTNDGEIKTALIRKDVDKTSLVAVENTFDIKAKQKLKPSDIKDQKQTQLRKSKVPNEASLKLMFKHNEQKKYVNNIGDKSDVIKQLNTKNEKNVNEKSQNTKKTVEVSLKTMSTDIEQNGTIRKHIEPNRLNGYDKKAKKSLNLQKPVDAVESSLAAIFNTTKQQDTDINMDIKQISMSRKKKEETTQLKVEVPLKANMVDQKHLNSLKISLSNKTNKHIKTGPECSQKSVNPTLTETNKNCLKQKANIKINAETSNVSNIKGNSSQKSGEIFTKSLIDIIEKKAKNKTNIIPLCTPEKYIKENAEHFGKFEDTQASKKSVQKNKNERPLGSENSTKKTLSLNSSRDSFMATHEKDNGQQSSISKNNKAKKEPLHKSKEKIDTKENNSRRSENKFKKPLETEESIPKKANHKQINTIEKKTSNVIPSPVSENYIHVKTGRLPGSENSTNKSFENAKSTLENFLSAPRIDVKPESEPLEKTKEKTKTTSKAIDTGEQVPGAKSKKPLETEENLPEKAKNKIDIISLGTPDKNIKEHLQILEDPDKKITDKPIDIIEMKINNEKPLPPSNKYCQETEKTLQNTIILVENIPAIAQVENNKAEKSPLKNSEETLLVSEATITEGEQKTNITSGLNISDKNKEEKSLLPSQDLEVISKSPENGDNQQNNNVGTSVEVTNPNKIIEDTFGKTSITETEKSLRTSASSNVENQAKSLETEKNKDDDLTKTKISNMEKTDKISGLGKLSEIAINSAAKQEQGTNKSVVVAVNKKDETNFINMTPLLRKLEARFCRYLNTTFTISSFIKEGRFSSIYKCNDIKGETYAVKVVHDNQIGMYIKEMLLQLQLYRPRRQKSCVLYLMGAFEIQGQWCLLTEYFPKNLEQALIETKRSFQIDQVQCLSKQLVDAVNMLTNAGIIHSDIRPTHILLNGPKDRLKLCGFDRSNYSVCAKILPNTGTAYYRAPEVILGFMEDHRIDVWSTAVVMFEMATNTKLFPEHYNNSVLYKQICTFGSMDDVSMVEQSRYRNLYFSGTSFIRKIGTKGRPTSFLIHTFHSEEILRSTLFKMYYQDWARYRTKWERTRDLGKLEMLHTLLEKMFTLDPRKRMPIQFVCASDFMNHQLTIE